MKLRSFIARFTLLESPREFHSTLTKMEAALQQYELGVLDENVLESFDSELFMLTAGTSFSRQNWSEQKNSFAREMREYVAELIEKYRSKGQ